jgi:methionyl-tRNA formyltransferase
MIKPKNVLFFGSCMFSKTFLEHLINGNLKADKSLFKRIGVVIVDKQNLFTAPKTSESLLEYCMKYNIDVYKTPVSGLKGWTVPNISRGSMDTYQENDCYNLALVASYTHYIPSNIIKYFSIGALNIHPSLLPRYRGASPIQQAILNRDKDTGVSIITLSEKHMDCGHIVKQSSIPLDEYTNFPTLRDRLARLAASDIIDILPNIEEWIRKAVPQQLYHPDATKRAPKFTENVSIVDFSKQSAHEIYFSHLAYSYYFDHLAEFYSLNHKKWFQIKILELEHPDASPLPSHAKKQLDSIRSDGTVVPFGAIYIDTSFNTLWIQCSKETWLSCKSFRIEGKHYILTPRMLKGYNVKMFNLHFRSKSSC